MTKKVCVAMSGGVDSSVAVSLMLDAGYDVCGLTMRMDKVIPFDALKGGTNTAVNDASAVAKYFGIEHHVIDLSDTFETKIIDYFRKEYLNGRTPNPCIMCNKIIKLNLLQKKAEELGYSYLATGHYAILDDGVLKKGLDNNKDQSYFLYVIYANNPQNILFPLGEIDKAKTRSIAQKIGIPTANKSESQDICFIPNGDYGKFISQKIKTVVGDIKDENGKVLGKHTGIFNYTIGQRKGIGALGSRMFVKEINTSDNSIIVSDNFGLMSKEVVLKDVIVGATPIECGMEYSVKVRYRAKPVNAIVTEYKQNKLKLSFSEPIRAVASGQSAVLYNEDIVIGGGVIS